mmetsp:Transcript_12691/g.23018  ORF Transcript_12691/g.23018 Transcript_12691/m.23018 type:complete len:113 (-) Transcript_12691:121-459(-)
MAEESRTLEFKEEVPKSHIKDRNKHTNLLQRIPKKFYPEVFKMGMPQRCMECPNLATSFELHAFSHLDKSPPVISVSCAPLCPKLYCKKAHNDWFHAMVAETMGLKPGEMRS